MKRHVSILLVALATLACRATTAQSDRAALTRSIRPLAAGETGLIVRCAKVLTLNEHDDVFAPGMLVVRNGKIESVGEPAEAPPGFEVLEVGEAFAAPGMVDLHSHVQTGGWGDINDMVYSVNPEFRTSPTIVPGNANIRRACAGGVTTLFGIPGSGTNMGGFGVLYKTKRRSPTYESVVLRDPGGMKIAQAYNPERGLDLGSSRAGMVWNLEIHNQMAIAANEQKRVDPALANLQRVHAKDLPVLIHTAGSDACSTTVRMWREHYDTRSVMSHGCFDGWKVAPYVARIDMPVNLGPRTIDYTSSRDGDVIGTPQRYAAAGVKSISVNTDAPVMPQEELFLQATMGARFGADAYLMLKAASLTPAQQFGIDQRVGSLAAGKDADIVLWHGDPLDPRSPVELVIIDGVVEYDRAQDGQSF